MKINDKGDGCEMVITKDLSLIYFPHLICCLLMGIISLGGYFKDKRSLILSNMLVLWAPLEYLSFLVQVGLSVYFFNSYILMGVSGFVFLSYIILNIVFYYQFNKKVGDIDEEYKFWRNLHPKSASFILILSRFISFKMVRLKYSYLYGFDNFKSRF